MRLRSDIFVSALTRRVEGERALHIEDVQDQVELALMRGGHHKVARAYVLYREDRAREREALRAKAERREQELEQRKLEADERTAQNAATRSQGRQRPDYANSAACHQSRERYNAASAAATDRSMGSQAQLDAAKRQMELDCMGPEAYGRLEASRPAPSTTVVTDDYWDRYPHGRPHPPRPQPQPVQPAPSITRCDVFKCVDSQGYSHPRGQIGETAPRPVQPSNPRNCRSQGGSAAC